MSATTTNDADSVATMTFQYRNTGASIAPKAKTEMVPHAPSMKGCPWVVPMCMSTWPKMANVTKHMMNPHMA
jgi:hypothetical protein